MIDIDVLSIKKTYKKKEMDENTTFTKDKRKGRRSREKKKHESEFQSLAL